MRAVVQRVSRAEVRVDARQVARIGRGLLVLLGVGEDDDRQAADYMARKIAGLRALDDSEGRMNLSVLDVGAEVLLVSQFTLYGDCRKGRRPSFRHAAPAALAEELYEDVAQKLRERGVKVATGRFQANMEVELVGNGPVTLLLDSEGQF